MAATLRYPLDFCPNGVPCSFGDVYSWQPLPFHYAAALRLGCTDVLAALDDHLARYPARKGSWSDPAELLLLHPRTKTRSPSHPRSVVRLYRGQDWRILADQLPHPHFYIPVRRLARLTPRASFGRGAG